MGDKDKSKSKDDEIGTDVELRREDYAREGKSKEDEPESKEPKDRGKK